MRVHYKGSSTFCCNSDAPCAEHAEKYPPAQSDALSAEEWRVTQRSYGVHKGFLLVTPPQFDKALEAYAALRTARAEQDLRNEKEERKSFEQGWLIEKGKRETAEAKVAQLEKDVAALAQVVKDYERINATLHEEIVSQINQVGIAENQVAQLERERDALRDEGIRWCVQGGTVVMVEKFDTMKSRAEAAEAALSETQTKITELEDIIHWDKKR